MRWTPEKIRDRREDLGLTQQELADRVGVSLRTITSWEAGDAKPQRPSRLDKALSEPETQTQLRKMTSPQLVARHGELLVELGQIVSELVGRPTPLRHEGSIARTGLTRPAYDGSLYSSAEEAERAQRLGELEERESRFGHG